MMEAIVNIRSGIDALQITAGGPPVTMLPSSFTRMLYDCIPGDLYGKSVLEIGTGSGALLIALKLFNDAGDCVGTDCDPAALEVARANALRNMAPEITFMPSDMFSRVEDRYDLIVCNPSSMPDALIDPAHVCRYRCAGTDGRDMIRRLATESAQHLTDTGELLFVCAGIADVERTMIEMAGAGFSASVVHAELFRLTERFTDNIMKRRRWIEDTGLSGELISVSGAEWFEMRYVLRGYKSPTPSVDLRSLRSLRLDAFRNANIEMRFAPSDNYQFHEIRRC